MGLQSPANSPLVQQRVPVGQLLPVRQPNPPEIDFCSFLLSVLTPLMSFNSFIIVKFKVVENFKILVFLTYGVLSPL